MAAYINQIIPAKLPHSIPQKDTLAWLMKAVLRSCSGKPDRATTSALNFYERLLSDQRIQSRHFYLEDFTHLQWDKMELFGESKPSLESRMAVYSRSATAFASTLYNGSLDLDFLIQVSCTGYESPHAIQKLAADRNMRAKCWHLGHMGCYAAVPAVQMANELYGKRSLFFHELCALHLQPNHSALDQVVINSLFADGAVRVDISDQPFGLRVVGSDEKLIVGTEDDMTWVMASTGFQMTLARSVPRTIMKELNSFIEAFLRRHGLALGDVSHFAIHPGGPRIIEGVSQTLNLTEPETYHSFFVMKQRGNLSSCSLPHIWYELLEDNWVKEGAYILSLAFGPGLTMAANLLQKGPRC